MKQPVICEKKTYTVAEIMEILGIGRTAAYDLTKKGLFCIVRKNGTAVPD